MWGCPWVASDLLSYSVAHVNRSRLGEEKEVTVAVTPNGYADAIVDDCFVTPLEHGMKMHHFLDVLAGRREKLHKGVYYIQKQNSNFVQEFSELHGDAEVDLPWATQVFGRSCNCLYFSLPLCCVTVCVCVCACLCVCVCLLCVNVTACQYVRMPYVACTSVCMTLM